MTLTIKTLAILAASTALAAAVHAAPPVIGIGGGSVVGTSSLAVGRTTSMNATGTGGMIGIGSTGNAAAVGRMGVGIGSAPVARQPAYIVPPYSGGNYVIANDILQTRNAYNSVYTPYAGVQPPIVIRPNFTPLNYTGLPGDFYARSTYYVPNSVNPIVTYPAPLTIQRVRTLNNGQPKTGLTYGVIPRR